jgi:hypothetical protein
MQSLAEIRGVPPVLLAHPGREHTSSGTTEINTTTGTVTCTQAADMSRYSFSGFRVEADRSAPLSDNFIIHLNVLAAAADPCVNLESNNDFHGEITVLCAPATNVVEVAFNGRIDSFRPLRCTPG